MKPAKKIKDYLANQRYWDVFVIPVEETVLHACELMEKNRVGALIVVDNKVDKEQSHIVGIVTERDIVKAIAHHQIEMDSRKVDTIMSKKLISVNSETQTNEAVGLMIENQIRHLAVIDKEKLVGVISMRDIFYSLNLLN